MVDSYIMNFRVVLKMKHFEGKYGFVDGDLLQLDQYHFCQELMDECPDNVTLVGYFESEKYFKHVENKVRENYEFLDFIQEKCYNYGKDYLKILLLELLFVEEISLQSIIKIGIVFVVLIIIGKH